MSAPPELWGHSDRRRSIDLPEGVSVVCPLSDFGAPDRGFIPCRRARNWSGAGMAPTLLACRIAGDIGGERGGRHRQQRVSTDPQSAPVDAFAGILAATGR